MEVDGHLNFGDKSTTVAVSGGVASVTLNSASGSIGLTDLPNNTGNINTAIPVNNNKVYSTSVVLLTFLVTNQNGPAPIVGLSAVNNGSFVIAIASGVATSLTVNFLVC